MGVEKFLKNIKIVIKKTHKTHKTHKNIEKY